MRTLLTRVKTEVTLGFSISGTSQQENSFSGGSLLGQLVEGHAGSFGSNDSVFGGLGEFEGADFESFWDVEESDVVGDGADDCDDAFELCISLELRVSIFGEVFRDAGDGDGEAVESGLVEPLVDDLVELIVGPSRQEGVELRRIEGTLIRLTR